MAFQLWGLPGLLQPTTISHHSTQIDLIKTVTLAAFFFSLSQTLTSTSKIKQLVYVVILTALAQSILGAAQQLFFGADRATGSFVNPNHLAGYLLTSLALAIGLMLSLTRAGPTEKRLNWLDFLTGEPARVRLIIVIMVIALVMTRSRMGNAAFLLSLAATCLIAFYYRRQKIKPALILFISIVLVDGALLGTYFGMDRLGERIQNSTEEVQMRVQLQSYNADILRQNLAIGTGAGTYEIAFTPYRDQHLEKKATHAETDYAEFLVELGLLGSLPLLLILASGLYAQIRLLRESGDDLAADLSFGCLAGTLAILIHGVTDVNLQIPSNALMFVLLLALPHAMLGHRHQSGKPDDP